MHISGKIGIPVGIVMLIIGGLIAASSISTWEESEKIENFMSEPSTEIILDYIDEDGAGSGGWYVMIGWEYLLDSDNDGVIDACEDDGWNITITDSQGNDMNSTSGNIYCGIDDNRKMAELDKSHVDIKDGWMISQTTAGRLLSECS